MIDYSNIRSGKNCIVWTRVSTRYQEENGGSIASQKELCERYARNNGYTIVDYCGGTHESARTPGKLITAMMQKVKRDNSISTILISEFDRFSRVNWQATKMLEELRVLGIIVVATKFGMETRTKEGMMMAQQSLSMAQWDNQNRTDKFVDGKNDCINSGAWCLKAPLGYYKEGKSRNTICKLNEDGQHIKAAFKWKLQRLSNMEILDKLSARGFDITKQTLHRILTNPFYAGKIQHKATHGELIDGQIEKAVSYTDFLKVQDILSSRTGKYTHAKQKPELPLTKHVSCYTDNTAFTSYTKTKSSKTGIHKYDYYKCNKNGCKTNVAAPEMHMKYENLLEKYNLTKEVLTCFEGIIEGLFYKFGEDAIAEKRLLKKHMTEIEKDIKEARFRFGTGKIDSETFEVTIKELTHKRDILSVEIENIEKNLSNSHIKVSDVIETACDLSSLWHNSDLETRRQIQNLVFPHGVFWDKEISNYRTDLRNKIFDLIERLSMSYKKKNGEDFLFSVALCGW